MLQTFSIFSPTDHSEAQQEMYTEENLKIHINFYKSDRLRET